MTATMTTTKAKQIKISLLRDGVEQKSWAIDTITETPSPVVSPAISPIVTPLPVAGPTALSIPVASTPIVKTSAVPAKAGCGCGAKKQPNGLPIIVNPPVTNFGTRVAGVGTNPGVRQPIRTGITTGSVQTQKFLRPSPIQRFSSRRPKSIAEFIPNNQSVSTPPAPTPLAPPATPEVIEQTVVNALSTKEWGPSTWNYLHLQAFYYSANPTEEERANKLALFHSVMNCIPCHICKKEAASWCEKYPIENSMHSGCKLSEWTLDFHNSVNKRLNKPTWTMEQMIKNLKLTSIPCQ